MKTDPKLSSYPPVHSMNWYDCVKAKTREDLRPATRSSPETVYRSGGRSYQFPTIGRPVDIDRTVAEWEVVSPSRNYLDFKNFTGYPHWTTSLHWINGWDSRYLTLIYANGLGMLKTTGLTNTNGRKLSKMPMERIGR